MKKFIIFAFLALLAGGHVGLLAQPAPGEDEDSPDGPGIVDENDPGIDPAVLEDFNENFAPWLQPPGLSIEGLPQPLGFELWKTGGGPELVQTLSNELGVWQAAERAEAEEYSKRTGMPLVWQSPPPTINWGPPVPPGNDSILEPPPMTPKPPTIAVMVGVEHNRPVYLTTFNVEAADTIAIDELWTTNSASTNGLSGLNLNGEGTQLAMWDGGDVLFTHREFATNRFTDSSFTNEFRVFNEHQMTFEGRATDYVPHGHATHVAGTLVASGVDTDAKGMSPGATLLAFNVTNDFTEMSGAFANTNNHFRISNHSYGQLAGWWGSTKVTITNQLMEDPLEIQLPVWRGDPHISATEDYRFGFYGERSQAIDDIAYWSRYYLSVWAAGNERSPNVGAPNPRIVNGYAAWFTQWTNRSGTVIRTNVPQLLWVGVSATPPASDFDVDGGYDLLTARAAAKNGLVVGAVHKIPGGYGALMTNVVTTTNITTDPDGMMVTNTVMTTNVMANTNVVMSAYSSWGPTDDGRIKPDVVAASGTGWNPGDIVDNTPPFVEGLHSTYTDLPNTPANTSYFMDFGTSMAAPTVAGSLNLLVQLHRRQVGNNQPMLASTLRALAIHTADEAGDHPGPDYRFGWGLFNALSAANLMTNNFHSGSIAHIKEIPLSDTRTYIRGGRRASSRNDAIRFPIVAKGGEPLKVTLCWNDPPPQTLLSPALDPTNRMLINNLDLHLHHYYTTNYTTNYPTNDYANTNTTTMTAYFHPWVLDPDHPDREARRGRNNRDNVEQVVVENPATNGVYHVNVLRRGELTFPLRPVTGSAMAYTNQTVLTNQWVSLLISGNVPQPEPKSFPQPRLLPLGNGTVALHWPSVVGRVYQVFCRTNTANLLLATGGLPVTGEIAATQTNTAVVLKVPHSNVPGSCYYQIRRVR